jgi:malic enzyme
VVEALKAHGIAEADARRQCWFVDSKGLVVASRTDLISHKRPFSHDHAGATTLLQAVESIKPNMLIGVSGIPGTFDETVVRAMGKLNQHPVIFALSNPTSKGECNAEQAYGWTDGRAVFASGSPFPDFDLEGRIFKPGQGNNAYIFPGVGLGLISSGAQRVTDEMFFVAGIAPIRTFPLVASIRICNASARYQPPSPKPWPKSYSIGDSPPCCVRKIWVNACKRSCMIHPTSTTFDRLWSLSTKCSRVA